MDGTLSESKFWTHEKTVRFIELFKNSPCLWSPLHPSFKETASKNEAWDDLSLAVGCDSIEARRKWKNLQGQFSRELKKLKQKRKSGASHDVRSTWNYYSHMSFVKSKKKKGDEEGDELDMTGEIEFDVEIEHNNTEEVGADGTTSTVAEPLTILREKTMPKRQAAAKSRKLISAIAIEDNEDDDVKGVVGGGRAREMLRASGRRDNSDIFGELVAGKMKRLKTEHARNTVEHLISNILWEASLGKYDHPSNIITSPVNDIIIESITH